MSVNVRRYLDGGWEVDIRISLPDGTPLRERRKAPGSSRTAAQRWGEARERVLLIKGKPDRAKEVRPPVTLKEFAHRFIEGHVKANQFKASGIDSKKCVLRVHLLPALGDKLLASITTEDVQQFKATLSARSPKTVNNILTVLNVLMRIAVEWDVIERVPCVIKMLKAPKSQAAFYDFDQFERLVERARMDQQAHLVVLLGGEAGLRCGEMIGLEWLDIDLDKRQLCVARSEWRGHVGVPKGGRIRYVPLTKRLVLALNGARHLRGPRVLCDSEGKPVTQKMVQVMMRRIASRANVKAGVHILRHTFCSHLAMRGAPARAIQELAGHQDLGTTQRYMHLSPAALEAAIRLLDAATESRGGIVEASGTRG